MPNDDLESVIRFGVFDVDRRSGELRRQGVRVRLRDQSFQVLILLLERPGQVVTREELRSRLWSADTFVDFDRGLNKAVNRLRDALGDSADSPRFIETLPRRGYRFIAPVQDLASAHHPPRSDSAHESAAAAWSVEPPAGLQAPAIPRTSARLRRITVAAWIALAVIATASYAFLTRRPAVLPEQARVVLAEFDNRTSDPAFDGTLKQALAIDLEQSPLLKVVSEDEVSRTLRLMHRRADERMTTDVARDVCQRSGGHAVLGGSVAILSTEYVLGLSAVNCRTGETLAREQVRARRKEDVLEELDKAASHLRGKLGESLSSVQKLDGRVHNVLSTSSLEAFQAYTNGERAVLGGRLAVPFFTRAIDLDPDFAYAHAALGLVYGTMGEASLSIESTRRAYELRERVSEWERYFITAQYYFRVTGEIEKIPSLCQLWIESYPRDRTAHNRLAYAYRQLGQYENALAEYHQARQLGGDHPIDLLLLATTYINLDRLDEASAVIRQALAANPDDRRFRQTQYLLWFLQNDHANMERHVASLSRNADAEDLLFAESDTEASFGRLGKARELARMAIESVRRKDFKGRAAVWLANDALREALFGNADAARRQAAAALELAPGWDVRVLAALALARTGGASQAGKLADQLNEEFPVSTLIQKYWLPAIRAEVDLSSGDPHAVERLGASSVYELADTSVPAGPPLYPAYVRGLAYLRARQGAASAAEFQKVLHHRGLLGNHPVGALAHLGLARAYALSGDTAGARTEYQYFVTLWKDADPENPVLEQARKEYGAIR